MWTGRPCRMQGTANHGKCTADSILATIAELLSGGNPEGKPLRRQPAHREYRCGLALRVLHGVSADGLEPASTPKWSWTGTSTTPSESEPEGTRDGRRSAPFRNDLGA